MELNGRSTLITNRLKVFSSLSNPRHWRRSFLFRKRGLNGQMVEPRLLHQLGPANLLLNMFINPSAQFFELCFVESLLRMVYWWKHMNSLESICVQILNAYYNLVIYWIAFGRFGQSPIGELSQVFFRYKPLPIALSFNSFNPYG